MLKDSLWRDDDVAGQKTGRPGSRPASRAGSRAGSQAGQLGGGGAPPPVQTTFLDRNNFPQQWVPQGRNLMMLLKIVTPLQAAGENRRRLHT